MTQSSPHGGMKTFALEQVDANAENIHDQSGACATVIRRQIEADAMFYA